MSRSISFLQNLSDTADLSTYTFSSANLGTAESDRLIIVTIGTRKAGATTSISSVTIGGISADIVVQQSNTATNTNVAGIAIAAVPTGTTGDIVITLGATMVRCAIGVYRATGSNINAFNTYSSTASAPTASVYSPLDGYIIGCVSTANNTSVTWSGITENYDVALETFAAFSGAMGQFTNPQNGLTVTATISSPNEQVGVFASWGFISTVALPFHSDTMPR